MCTTFIEKKTPVSGNPMTTDPLKQSAIKPLERQNPQISVELQKIEITAVL